MKVLIFLFVFFMISALVIVSNNNLSLIKDENVNIFVGFYLDWLDGIYSNIQVLTGEFVKLSWMPE